MTLKKSTQNPRYFEDTITGNVILLTGSHTWNTMKDNGTTSPPPVFDFNGYLTWLKSYNHNFLKLWAADLTRYGYGGDTRYSAPSQWQRTGPGNALDGQLKFDLTKLDQSYFDRLRTRVLAAKAQNMYVSIMMFEGYGPANSDIPWCWDGHSFNINNNINGINGNPNADARGTEVYTLQIPAVTAIQEAYVKKVIDTVYDLDNVLYEIANDCMSDSRDWQYYLINLIKNYEATKGVSHPVGMTSDGADADLISSNADWISPMTDSLTVTTGNKVFLMDTNAVQSGSSKGAVWIWEAFCRGYNPIFMDTMAYTTSLEDARKAMGNCLTYANKLNLKTALPTSSLSDCSTGYCLYILGTKYLFYQPLTGSFTANITSGTYYYEWFNPLTSVIVEQGQMILNGTTSFTPPFSGNAVLYLSTSPIVTTGSISFNSIPSGADIYLDNILQSNKTNTIITDVLAGIHSYTLKLTGYNDATGTVTVTAGLTSTVSRTLTPVVVCNDLVNNFNVSIA